MFLEKKFSFRILMIVCALTAFCLAASAQEDANPDSPVPVLLNAATDATRILAVDAAHWNGRLPRDAQQIFRVNAKSIVTVFATNIELMPDETANAFRVYLTDAAGKSFRLPVENVRAVGKNIFALDVRLQDETGFRGQPAATGDAVVYLAWRGLASNRLKIGLGKTGGDAKIPDALKFGSAKFDDAPESDLIGYRWSGDRVRFMEQAAFGASSELDARLRRIGLRVWLGEQFDAPYPTIPYPNPPQMQTNPPADCMATTNPTCYRDRYTTHPLQQWFFKEALYGNSQLRHRLAWTLSQIFVTSGVSIQQSSHMIAYHKVLSRNAFGNYRDLLKEMTLNATMGDYLDTARSTKNNPNENYAREILQLFSIGLFMLNQDGTFQRDSNNQPIPSYNQNDINNFAKVFTGWTFCNQTCENSAPGIVNYKDPLTLIPANHDTSAKTLLNYPNANPAIAACADCSTPENTAAYAEDSLNRTIDNIFNHPNVAPYVSRLLIQHLVTSDPTPAYVGRVAAVFSNNGAGVRGDLKAVVRSILLDPEARGNIKTEPRYGKLREPVQLITNLGRQFPAKSFSGAEPSDGSVASYTAKLGQNPFNSPTVFNYFPPNYTVPGTTLNAPEFGLLNTGTAASRINLLYTLIFFGFEPNTGDSLRGTSLDYSEILPFAEADASGNQLLDYLNNKMMHGAMTAAHRAAILTAVTAVPASNPLMRSKTAIYLIAASSQYQVQR